MLHQPPSGLGMDICEDGRQVGSPTVQRFITDHQPLLGCSGHIHESPYRPGGRWMAQVGRTVWVQPGQMATGCTTPAWNWAVVWRSWGSGTASSVRLCLSRAKSRHWAGVRGQARMIRP